MEARDTASIAARSQWQFTGESMASPLRLVVTGRPDEADAAARAWDAVRAIFEDAEQALSRFRESSDLTQLNRRAGQEAAGVARLLVRALVVADRAYRRTGGRFDPRVLGDLERLGSRGAQLDAAGQSPDAPGAEPRARRPAAGRILRRAGRQSAIRLNLPVDLGGIGKGLALRWAANRAAGTLSSTLAGGGGFLIDAGRDLASRGSGPDAGPWLVDIEDPSGTIESLAVTAIPADGSVATSSVRLQCWVAPDGRPVHHLIDPRTGEPGGEGLSAVTVAGPDPAWAEVWSKALFLEGGRGIAALARREGLAAWWATDDGRLEMTPAARVRTVWLAAEQGRPGR